MPVVELGPERCDALRKFFAELPEGDLTFIKEEVTDPETVRSWATDASPGGRWVSVEDDEVTGYVAVRPLPGWAAHGGGGGEQGAALALFTDLGFTGEALLRDHIRDRGGELRDLMVLAHHVSDTWSGMDTVGIAEELGSPAG